VKYKDSDICVCGHRFDDHDCHTDGYCLECLFSDGIYGDGVDECQGFKLDNLKYVEDKAKKRKLL